MLKRVAAGERLAVRECMTRYGPLVWYLARALSATRPQAEDAAEEIFLDIWRSADSFDASQLSEVAFIMALAKRCLLQRLQKTDEIVDLSEAYAI